MSHFSKIKTNITDREALKNALSNMGLTLESNAPCRYFYGETMKENVCKLPGKYDVAFTPNADGKSYYIDADFYNGDVERSIGKKGSKLMRQYSIEKVKIEAKKQGFDVIVGKSNKIKIYDPTDSSGGYLECSLSETGNLSIKAQGFVGSSCMKFQNLEEALGSVSREYTEEYYEPMEQQFLTERY